MPAGPPASTPFCSHSDTSAPWARTGGCLALEVCPTADARFSEFLVDNAALRRVLYFDRQAFSSTANAASIWATLGAVAARTRAAQIKNATGHWSVSIPHSSRNACIRIHAGGAASRQIGRKDGGDRQ